MGMIGNVLDTLPMDPAKRVELKRTSAVISNTFSARTLSVVLATLCLTSMRCRRPRLHPLSPRSADTPV